MPDENARKSVSLMAEAQELTEGAGVRIRRTIALPSLDYVDPFLLLDEFKSNDPTDYIAGFPWHPHRGIETVTYMLSGRVEHGDSIGNSGSISGGEIQWMTAGRGIVHQEMPKPDGDGLWGLQLWVNLPRSEKMCPPRYQDIPSDEVPEVGRPDGSRVRVVCGSFDNATGPVTAVAAEPTYLDVALPPGASFERKIPRNHSVFCYCLEGRGVFDANETTAGPSTIVVFAEDGEKIEVSASPEGMRFLVVSGKAFREPVARGGPFVMNTREEILQAFREYETGTFLRDA